MENASLHTSLEFLKGVGQTRAKLLDEELGLKTYHDLLHFFPRRYIDRTRFYKISELINTQAEVQLFGSITAFKEVPQKRGSRLVATFSDGNNTLELVWFKGVSWVAKQLKINTPVVIFGRVNVFNNSLSMPHPELDYQTNAQAKLNTGLFPVYASTEKLSQKGMSNRLFIKMLKQVLAVTSYKFTERLPQHIVKQLQLITINQALKYIHFPTNTNTLAQAELRFKFEELFYFQFQMEQKRWVRKQKIKGFPFKNVGQYFHKFYNDILPFPLTEAQKRVLKEIRADLGRTSQMNRLLQGDVGSGKTVVAFMCMLLAADNGFQSCLMAPTEILATQHYENLKKWGGQLGLKIDLLTGSTSTKKRKEIHELLNNGKLSILIGTHAVLEDKVTFNNLGLAVIDEQHRFGVAQRSKLWKKNHSPPHVLVMTATPIPRTLFMSLQGDLDESSIDQLPPGRKPIKTLHRYDANRLKVFWFLKNEIKKGRQVYIVYPLIKESQKLDLKDLMDGYESIVREFPQPEYQVSIVHGQMKAADKAYEMQLFLEGKTQIMVATTVIEVGVHVANATVMVIENAERFGLAQLHQLRGRVGRGAAQSYCILMTSHALSADAKTRIETLVNTQNGFEIAEVDLRLRGEGDVLGTLQSGKIQFKLADFSKDKNLLRLSRNYVLNIIEKDPELKQKDHQCIARVLHNASKNKLLWSFIS